LAAISHRLGLLAVWASLALPAVARPADLHVDVVIEGAEGPAITKTRLAKMTPEYDDGHRRAFAMADFLGWLYQRPDVALEVEDGAGRVARYEKPGQGLKLVLVVAADGSTHVALLDASQRLGDGGAAVRRLRLVLSPVAGAEAPPPELALELDGKSQPAWRLDDLGPATVEITGDGGAKRSGWPLRELLSHRIGAHARVVAVAGNESATIDAAEWNDRTRIPVLRLNRRHAFRLQWIARDGSPAPGPSVRNVTALRVVSR
jgi:hypothetical protein